MKISQLNLTTQYHSIKKEIDSAIESVLESGIAINGTNVAKIEKSICGKDREIHRNLFGC